MRSSCFENAGGMRQKCRYAETGSDQIALQEHMLMLEAGTGGCLYSFSIAGYSEEADVGSSVLLGHCTRVGIF